VNKQLVQAVHREGTRAVGLCGGDGGTFLARKWTPEGSAAGTDLGYVGEICRTDTGWLEAIWAGGAVPILSSIALGTDGDYYNVNADAMASACSVACRADYLFFLTDVAGVRGADGVTMKQLSLLDLPELIASGVISGGMLPKLRACAQALHGGVKRVQILPAVQASQAQEIFSNLEGLGTEVVA